MVNVVAVLRLADAKVIPMRREDYVFIGLLRAFEQTDHVPGIHGPHFVFHFHGSFDPEGNGFEILLQRLFLHVVKIEARGIEQRLCYTSGDPALKGNGRGAFIRSHDIELFSGPGPSDDFPWIARKLRFMNDEGARSSLSCRFLELISPSAIVG